MINTLSLEELILIILPYIINNIITIALIHKFMVTFLGPAPSLKNTSKFLYALFFIADNILSLTTELFLVDLVPYDITNYFQASLYAIQFIIIISIAFCYKPSSSTGLSSGTLTGLVMLCSIPIANYIFDTIYKYTLPNFDLLTNISKLRHIYYIIFEEYQQVFIYSLEIVTKLLFLFAVLRVKRIYDERNIYYFQASYQEKNHVELKQFRHDIMNHMVALNQMLSSNDLDKALSYLATLTKITNSCKLFSQTGNVAIDSIINFKLSKAERNDISCTYTSAIPKDLVVRDEDIIIILGNLLDNAIDACLTLEDKKYIDIKLTYQCGLLYIEIANSFNGIVNRKGSKLATVKPNKRNHGIGLTNVQKALSHYNGTYVFKTQATNFIASAIMYINK